MIFLSHGGNLKTFLQCLYSGLYLRGGDHTYDGGNGTIQSQKIHIVFLKGMEKVAHYAVAVPKVRAIHSERGHGRN